MGTPILPPTPENIARAVAALRAGELVAMPTETVYGLAGDASNPQAVERIYDTKQRPGFNPLIGHVASPEAAFTRGSFSDQAKQLARTFWPGSLTLVVEAARDIDICPRARAGLDSIALRVPAHPVAQALLSAFGGPLVAPSANPSGRISPTEAAHVAADLTTGLAMVLDGGPCHAGLESTIIDARGPNPVLLRPGAIAADEIEAVWPGLVRSGGNTQAPASPGQLLRHYAPKARLRLNAKGAEPGEALLGFGPMACDLNLSETGDLGVAARNLFAMLRQLDATFDRIAVAAIPKKGLGEAINDRLARAARK